MYKKRIAHAKLLFCLFNQLLFWHFPLSLPSSLHKHPIHRRLRDNWLQVSNVSLESKTVLKTFITLSKGCYNLHEQLSTFAPVDNNQVSDLYRHPKHNCYPGNLTKNKLLLHVFSGTSDKVKSGFSGQNVLKWNVCSTCLNPLIVLDTTLEPLQNGRCREV